MILIRPIATDESLEEHIHPEIILFLIIYFFSDVYVAKYRLRLWL